MGVWVALLAVAAAQSWLLTLIARHLAPRIGFLDRPDTDRKFHLAPTPLLGGVAVCLSLLSTVVISQFIGVPLPAAAVVRSGIAAVEPIKTLDSGRFVIPLLSSMALLCGVGVWDDKVGMKAGTKFLLQILAVLPFTLLSRGMASAQLLGWQIDLAWLSIPVTIFWLVACTNFVNLVDGLDGLASTVTLIVVATIAVLSSVNNEPQLVAVSVALCGALLGFLCHNWPPAKIFLGDSGSLPLGFLAGALALESSVKRAAGVTLVMPLVLLSIPLFDTTMAIIRRKLTGRRIGQGDRAHIHHCLRDRGLSPQQTLLTIGGLCLATSVSVVLSAVLHNEWIAVVMCGALLAALVAGKVFGFREAQLIGQHSWATWSALRSLPQALRSRFFLLQLGPAVAERWPELWNELVKHVQRSGGVELRYSCRDVRTAREMMSLEWKRDVALEVVQDPRWEIRFTTPRADGVSSELLVQGVQGEASHLPQLNQLLELFAAFCKAGPLDDVAVDRATLHGPHFLKVTRPAVRRVHRDAA